MSEKIVQFNEGIIKERLAYHKGHSQRNLTTTSSDVKLNVPRLKGAAFETVIIEQYRQRRLSLR